MRTADHAFPTQVFDGPAWRRVLVLAVTALFACACALLAAPPAAHASSDVKTVQADDLVYRGGYYDYQVEAVGFTAKSYKWYMKYGEGSGWTYNHSIDHVLDGQEDPEWFSGFNTNHLRLCTNNWKEDSDFDDWGAFKFYCIVTDTQGKKHYSDDFRMNIKGTSSFNEKYADQQSKGFGLSFASASPAQDPEGVTNVEMKLGESKTFSFTVDDKTAAWLSESEPQILPVIEVGAADLSAFHEVRKGESSYTFKPEQAGYYLVYMGAHLQLGYNYDTKVGIAHYYVVNVTEPGATPEPPDDGYIGSISAARLTIPEPYVAYSTPTDGMALPSESDGLDIAFTSSANPGVASASVRWYRSTPSGWKPCADLGDTQFKDGNAYQLRAEFVADGDHYFKNNLRGAGFTVLTVADELEGPAQSTGHGGGTKRTSVAWNKSYLPVRDAAGTGNRVAFAVREFTVGEASSPDLPAASDKESYAKPDGTLATSEFVEIDGAWYYFDADSNMVTGWKTIDGKLYYFDGKGKLVSSKDGVTDMAKGSVKVAGAVYTGKACKPAPKVSLYGKTLKAGTDYTVAYKDNVNAGTATVTVKGAGSFSGTLSQTFKISKAASSISLGAQTATYTGKALAYSGKVTRAGSAGRVSYAYYSDAACKKAVKAAAVKNAGAYYVKATLAADANHNAATSAAAKLTVAKAKAAAKAKKATVTLKASGLKKKAKAVANLSVTCDKGKASYKNVSKNKTARKFKVDARTGKVTVPKGTKADTYAVKVKVTVKAGANYRKLSKTVTFKVKVK